MCRHASYPEHEAQALAIPAAMVATFKANCNLAFKTGGYTINGKSGRSLGAFLRLPFVVSAQITRTP